MAASKDVPTGVTVAVLGVVIFFAVTLIALTSPIDPAVPTTADTLTLDFDTEVQAVQADLGRCVESRVTPPPIETLGRLYGCISGKEETAKFFINEDVKRPGTVRNIKMMWNEWKAHTPDAGADRGEAERMLRVVVQRYAPTLEAKVLEAYWLRDAKVFDANGYRFEYQLTSGSSIDEHLLTITPEQ